VELARSDAQRDLDAARAASAALALRQAASATAVGDLSARYPTARLVLATLVAKPLGADPAKLDAAWAGAVDARVDVVYAALAQVGDPYVWATAGPDEFDCSGLTAFAWKAAGVVLPHYTVLQRQAALDATEGTLRPGDLVFNLDGPNGGHVQLYLGIGRLVVQAPSPGHNVNVSEYRTTTGFGSPMDDSRSLGDAASATIGDVPSH
jgi:peptidoglycan DL-endopeptidase CwlO